MFLTFFTNLVLMACFLGMSVGLMSAGRRRNLLDLVLPLALLAVAAAILMGSTRISSEYVVDVGRQKSPQEVFFGTEPQDNHGLDTTRFVIPIEALAGGFFVLIALTFVGLGQVMGRAFDAIPDRVLAYTVDILGSLAGIAAFGLMSWGRMPPEVWFTVVACLVLWFFPRLTWLQAACGVLLVGQIGWWDSREATAKIVIWSSYYKIFYNQKQGTLSTNNINHQMMVDVGEKGRGVLLAAPFEQGCVRNTIFRGDDHRGGVRQRCDGRARQRREAYRRS